MKLCIDIGHGRNTYPPSKGIGDFAEWEFNNAVGEMAKELAEVNGFEVYLTQPIDQNEVYLRDRINRVNAEKVDLGISIHANASGESTAQGHEFWYWSTSQQGKKLATILDTNAIALLPNKRRGLKISATGTPYNFGILRETKAPFALCEFGFFTNPNELKLLRDDNFRRLCAKVVVKSACDFVGRPFRTLPEPPKPSLSPWKTRGLEELNEAGFVTDINYWMNRLDDNAPVWMVYAMVNNIYQQLKKEIEEKQK